MKRKRWMQWISLVCLSGMLLCSLGPSALASDGNRPSPQIVDVFSTEPHYVMDTQITGDLGAMGQIVSVPGQVGGDLLAAASELHVNGSVEGNLRSVTTVLDLQGHVRKNLTAYASRVRFAEAARIGGNVYLLADTAYLAGNIGGNLAVYAQKLELEGRIEGDVFLHGPANAPPLTLLLHPGTVIAGTLRYPEGTVVTRNGSTIGGEEVIPGPQAGEKGWTQWNGLKWAIRQVLTALLLYLVSLALLRLYPGFFAQPTRFLQSRPKSVLGTGLAFFGTLAAGGLLMLLAGTLAAFLFSPLIVVAMVLLVLVVFTVSLLLSVVPVTLWLGEQLRRGSNNIPGSLATGMGVLTAVRLLLRLLGSVPFLGPIVVVVAVTGGFLIWVVGSGAVLQGIRFYHEKAAVAIADGGQEGANPDLFRP